MKCRFQNPGLLEGVLQEIAAYTMSEERLKAAVVLFQRQLEAIRKLDDLELANVEPFFCPSVKEYVEGGK